MKEEDVESWPLLVSVRLTEAKRWFGVEPDADGKPVIIEAKTELKAVAA